ncbi:MAG: DUF4395 domain-containing protein [Deltaproteobacteria bacterium]|nr:DUF4395 domain-containing protein [Candidatus Tharpella sp.]
MSEVCPISFQQVNEKAAQVNAVLVAISVMIFLITPFKLMIYVLAADFFIRGFADLSYSLYGFISRTVLRICKIKPVMVNAGPKIFAAKIGFIFCCVIAFSSLFNFSAIVLVFSSIFIFFAVLEAAFRFCVACRLYPYVHKFQSIRKS